MKLISTAVLKIDHYSKKGVTSNFPYIAKKKRISRSMQLLSLKEESVQKVLNPMPAACMIFAK